MRLSKRSIAVSAAIFTIVGGSAAFAYYTTTGVGTGTGAVDSTTTGTITLTTEALDGLKPGATVSDKKVFGANSSTTDAYTVETISLATTPITVDTDHADAGCLASWFSATLTQPSGVVSIPASGTETELTGARVAVEMENAAVNQDACKGATVTVDLVTP
jgi:hypothetical protein